MYVCMYVCTYVRMYVRMYVCMYVRMYVCVYIYICYLVTANRYFCQNVTNNMLQFVSILEI